MAKSEAASRRLHIGGHQVREGWEILDARPGEHVDHVGEASDLSRFADASYTAIYASHVLEHFDYKDEIIEVLRGWRRVLRPGGSLYVSVPDMESLCRLYLQPERSPPERFEVMRMLFGGHMHDYDYHMAGIDQHYLEYCLIGAGFVSPLRVATFNLFQDNSEYVAFGMPISLNMVASRPLPE